MKCKYEGNLNATEMHKMLVMHEGFYACRIMWRGNWFHWDYRDSGGVLEDWFHSIYPCALHIGQVTIIGLSAEAISFMDPHS